MALVETSYFFYFLENKFSRFSLQLGFVFLLAQILALLAVWRSLPPQVPLFYSRPWGEEQLASPQTLWLLPGLSLAVTLTNFFTNLILTQKQAPLRQILSATSSVFSLLCLITLGQIIRLVV